MWSFRDGSDPEWRTVNEPGAFEPPYQAAFTAFHLYGRRLALSPGLQAVHERSVEGGMEVFCGDAADAEENQAGDSAMDGTIRFVIGADGTVTEAVLAMVVGENDSVCVESAIRHGAGIEVPELRVDQPSDSMAVTLEHLDGCQAIGD